MGAGWEDQGHGVKHGQAMGGAFRKPEIGCYRQHMAIGPRTVDDIAERVFRSVVGKALGSLIASTTVIACSHADVGTTSHSGTHGTADTSEATSQGSGGRTSQPIAFPSLPTAEPVYPVGVPVPSTAPVQPEPSPPVASGSASPPPPSTHHDAGATHHHRTAPRLPFPSLPPPLARDGGAAPKPTVETERPTRPSRRTIDTVRTPEPRLKGRL